MIYTNNITVHNHHTNNLSISNIGSIANLPWTGPDWEKAKVHADYYKPRRGGRGGKVFEFSNTTTGRHCCLSGVGEQMDIFKEGQTSEFGIYGSGVTNYFKFLKWCIGTCFALALITLPALFLNYYGPRDDATAGGFSDLSLTSMGNLVRYKNSYVNCHREFVCWGYVGFMLDVQGYGYSSVMFVVVFHIKWCTRKPALIFFHHTL